MPKFGFRKFLWLFLLGFLSLVAWASYSYARGLETWRAWKDGREAKGESFAWRGLALPPIPDGTNAAMDPALRDSMVGAEASPLLKRIDLGKELTPDIRGWRQGHRVALPDPREPKGRELARNLELRKQDFSQLAEAISRPDCRIPVSYEDGEAPTLLGFRAAFRALGARALLRLRSGNHEGAAQDALVGLRMSWHLRREPSLLAHLLSVALTRMSLQVIWEGLVDHSWTDLELSQFETQLAKVDFLASGRKAFEGERLNSVMMFEAMAEGRPVPIGPRGQDGGEPMRAPWYAKPWIYQNLLEVDRFFATCYLNAIEVKANRVFPDLAAQAEGWPDRLRNKPHLVLARIALPALVGQLPNLAETQAHVGLARVACALERHRRVNGSLPESLDALSPTWLDTVPQDVMTGAPLRYVHMGQHFRLYSLGWDTLDQGGVPMPSSRDHQLLTSPGDWVWFSEIQP